MKAFLFGAALALLVAGQAMANPCTGTLITNCNAGSDDNINNVSNKAYGGSGGSANQSQQQQMQQKQKQDQSQSSSNSNTNEANNAGNSQAVNFNDVKQAPAISSFIAASGPCTGVSGGGAVSVAGFGMGLSFASLEEDCKKRELLRIGFASGNPHIAEEAAQGWDMMFKDAFGGQQQKGTQTSALPVATSEQLAAVPAKPDSCKYAGITSAWYQGHCQ